MGPPKEVRILENFPGKSAEPDWTDGIKLNVTNLENSGHTREAYVG